MKLFTPFTIPKKDNCDLCRIKTIKRKAVENPFLDNFLETFIGRDSISFLTDLQMLIDGLWLCLIKFFYSKTTCTIQF